tara:strand:- start:491 stop:913 length:423 start_codon:yes stop_codon:yes gene_type:complete
MNKKVVIIGIIGVILVGAVLLLIGFSVPEQPEEQLTEQQKEIKKAEKNEIDARAGVLFISGPVTAVNIQERSFVLQANDDRRSVTILVGQDVDIQKIDGLNFVEGSFSDISQGSSVSVKSESLILSRIEINDVVSLTILN